MDYSKQLHFYTAKHSRSNQICKTNLNRNSQKNILYNEPWLFIVIFNFILSIKMMSSTQPLSIHLQLVSFQ